MVDHLFRHQYGKMVAILTKIFGPSHLELVEDALQDTFLKASLQWRKQQPENPEAWLIQAAKNRSLDLLRQIKARESREESFQKGRSMEEIEAYFLDHEVQDSQLRMLFLACHPSFNRAEQIAFALKSIAGFSQREIAHALLLKEETVKKRLARARKKIKSEGIELEYPGPEEIQEGLKGVMQIIYLIFNEGFHSTKKEQLVDKELCGEALRLAKLLLSKENFRSGSLYALFALLCFNSARLDAKQNEMEILDLKQQDRKLWYKPLIELGQNALQKAFTDYPERSAYHFEAFIAWEHCRAKEFEDTNWEAILSHYNQLYQLLPSEAIKLSRANVLVQLQRFDAARQQLSDIELSALEGRQYLYYATKAELEISLGQIKEAQSALEQAISLANNRREKAYLQAKLLSINI